MNRREREKLARDIGFEVASNIAYERDEARARAGRRAMADDGYEPTPIVRTAKTGWRRIMGLFLNLLCLVVLVPVFAGAGALAGLILGMIGWFVWVMFQPNRL